MRAILAAYCAGVLLGMFAQHLFFVALASLCTAVLLVVAARRTHSVSSSCSVNRSSRQRLLWLVASLLLGLGYHALWASHALSLQLPAELVGETLVVQGEVASIPRPGARATGFLFRISAGPEPLTGRMVRLGDYSDRELRSGQRWQFRLRLRPPHGLANPGGFDSESWFLQRGVVATGYVQDEGASLSGSRRLSLAALRGELLQRMEEVLPTGSHGQAILPALLLGYDAGLTSGHRQLFARTGTSHLFVISGLHIGLVAASVLLLTTRSARHCSYLSTRLPVQHVAAWAALVAASFYALLSGFELPAQRALIMLAVFLVAGIRAQAVNVWMRYLLALAIVLTLNPLAAGSAGFWFSFVAVAVLLLMLPARNGKRGVYEIVQASLRLQLAIFVGMLLPLAFWMGQVSLLAPLINLVAIPFIGLLVVPLAFLAALGLFLNEALGAFLFAIVGFLLEAFINGLQTLIEILPRAAQLAQLDLPAVGPLQILLGILAVIVLLLPWSWQWRWLAVPLLLPSVVGLRVPVLSDGDDSALVLRIFDVGQGLSILVSAGDRHLLYDTGAGDEQGFSMARSAVLPALRALGIGHLDKLFISHWDNDHAGGVTVLREAQPGLRIVSSSADTHSGFPEGEQGSLCRAGQSWHWGRARFAVLHPSTLWSSNNDNSCVVQIRFGEQGILIPGDISRRVELELARKFSRSLASTVLIAPHHGSQTSSSYPLLKTVDPDWVVFSAGANNSFGHPAPRVVRRYAEAGVGLLDTANSGMITFRLDGSDEAVRPERFRATHRRYWRRSQNDYWCRYSEQVCDTLSR